MVAVAAVAADAAATAPGVVLGSKVACD